MVMSEHKPPNDLWGHWDIAMDRFVPGWVPPLADHGLKSLHLGAGFKLIDGWDNLDYPEWDPEDPEYVLPYGAETVGAIACHHTLDHLTPDAVIRSLIDWQRVLAPGAAATIVVPHYSSQLANECIQHKSRFGIDTFRNIFSERQYNHWPPMQWDFRINFNMLLGVTERNLVQVTQLVRAGWV